MKLIHRFLLVWLLLLALPFQGLASASMLACAPAVSAPAMVAKTAGADGGHCAAHHPNRQRHHGHGDHHGGKAGACSACCVGVAMAPAALPALAAAPSRFISIPFRAGHVPSVDLALPERPPRPLFA